MRFRKTTRFAPVLRPATRFAPVLRPATRALMLLSTCLGAWAGCSPKKQTEIVPGVSTQVRVPKDMKSVRLDVNVGGQNRFCNVYDVTNGVAHLPRTLGLQSGGNNGPVKITVTGYRFKADDPEAPTEYTNCDLQPTVSKFVNWDQRNPDKGFARILRSSRMPYVVD